MRNKNGFTRLQAERGQSMVEMALMMVIMLIILSAVLDLGRGFFSYIAINNAAGEGALYAAINPNCASESSGAQCLAPNNVEFRAKHESPSGLVDINRMSVRVTQPDAIQEGQPITVTVLYSFTLLGPFSPALPNGQLVFVAHAVQNILDVPTP